MTDNLKSQKQTYREQARLHRDKLDVNSADLEKIVDVFFENFEFTPEIIFASYWPVGKEFDCRALMDELTKRGFQCALPVTTKESRVMKFFTWSHDSKMKQGVWNVLEPEDGKEVSPDVVLAPMLAFDQKGNRLGQGGGHYDATIENLRKNKDVTFIGVGYAEQAVLFKLPQEDHDIKMDFVLTPQGVIDF